MAAASGLSGWLHRVSDSDVWWSFKSSPMTVAAAVATFLIIAVAFLSPVLAPHTPFDPATLSLSDGLKPPVLVSPDGDWAFPLGTDDQGRDVLSSIMYGTRLSLVVSLAAVAVAMVLGISLGLISGYFGGAIDAVIMRVADVQLTFPAILVALLIDGVVRGIISVKRHDEIAIFVVVGAIGLSLFLPPLFTGTLLAYLALTTAYTFSLKRKMMVDVVTLAGLYTIRVMAGAAAIGVPVSEWLLGFSILIFTSLALIKRYIELAARLDADLPNPSNRNYQKSDLNIVATLAASSGFNAVTLFALYISSPTVATLYSHPAALWLICPILMYWLSRALIMAHRRFIDDDPVAFALRDRNSLMAAALIGLILIGAK